MLVLSRRKSQSIMIGKDIIITLIECGPEKARIGIEAPREVPIYRTELLPVNQPLPEEIPPCLPL